MTICWFLQCNFRLTVAESAFEIESTMNQPISDWLFIHVKGFTVENNIFQQYCIHVLQCNSFPITKKQLQFRLEQVTHSWTRC